MTKMPGERKAVALVKMKHLVKQSTNTSYQSMFVLLPNRLYP